MPLRSYLCKDEAVSERPNVTLLGWFAEGACEILSAAPYDPGYCRASNVASSTEAAAARTFAVRFELSMPMQIGELTEHVQTAFRTGIALAAAVHLTQVRLISNFQP